MSPEPQPAAPSKEAARAEAGVPKVELKDLHISYRDQHGRSIHAVDGVSLRIDNKPEVGELGVLLGPSGCGKSTILKAISGLLTPDSGSIHVEGTPVTGTGRDRGMVFQSYTSFGWLTVRRNVEYGLKLQGVPAPERRTKAMQVLEQVALQDFAEAYPKELSGGMKQRVAIARTLINQPKLVLMDEPFGALDPQTRWGMQALILDVLRKLDNTVLFVTHDISEAVFLGDVIFIFSHRPAKLLHRVEVPYFEGRDPELKQSSKFREVENHILGLLKSLDVKGNVRVGL